MSVAIMNEAENKAIWRDGDAYDPAQIFLAYYNMADKIASKLCLKYGFRAFLV